MTDFQKLVDEWKLDANIYDTVPNNGSPIAATASYFKTTTGFSSWVERLSISNRGVQVSAKSGALDKWIQEGANPSVMANSTTNQKRYSGVAVTAIGSAFGVVSEPSEVDKIRHWQVEDDTVNWKSIGNLNLSDSWKINKFDKNY